MRTKPGVDQQQFGCLRLLPEFLQFGEDCLRPVDRVEHNQCLRSGLMLVQNLLGYVLHVLRGLYSEPGERLVRRHSLCRGRSGS